MSNLREKRNRLKLEGLCIDCRKQIDTARSKSRCLTCLERSSKSSSLLRERRLLKNLCLLCGGERQKGYLNCEKCRKINAKYCKGRYENSADIRLKRLISKYKAFDLKRELHFNLNLETLKILISNGCSYCGEKDLQKMGADRIDNSQGHSSNNLVASCFICNRMRMNINYSAWLIIAPGVKKAKELGLI